MSEQLYKTIRSAILLKLSNHLATDLFYHGVHHTIDVEQQALSIACKEKITSPEDLFLLKLGCLYHDAGFLFTYRDHELAGCELAKKELPAFGVTPQHVDIICGLIMATKIPQTPHTRLEEIICDADLDYLGRDDFSPISDTLFEELKIRGIVATRYNWNIIQINFFKQHHYCTATSQQMRATKKQLHLEMIVAINEELKMDL